MKIAIDLTSLSYHLTGIERYALCITKELLINDNDNEYILIFRNEIFSEIVPYINKIKHKTIVLSGDNKLLFYQITLLKCLNRIDSDKYLFLAFVAPFLFKKSGCYSAIHDMVMWDYPETLSFTKVIYARLCCLMTKLHADGIITVSDFSKNRIADVLKVKKEKIHIVYSAITMALNNNSNIDIHKQYDTPSKYILTLSTLEPRKNMGLLLKAFSNVADRVDYDLVLVGRTGWKIEDFLKQCACQERVHVTGYVDDKDIGNVYKNAMCFVFPSLYEGFGLPPVEALALGTPVIASDAASMPEVLRNQAIYFKCNDQQELEKLLLNLKDTVDAMPHGLDEFQKENYRFDVSAKKILSIIEQGSICDIH